MGTTNVYQVDDIGVIELNTPDKLNAFTRAMRATLVEAVRSHESDRNLTGIVITGAGVAFCAGQDLNESATWDESVPWVEEFEELFRTVWSTQKPVVAAIPGVAAGGGFQLALLCDYRVGTPSARMGQPEVRNGLASVTGTWLMQRSIGDLRARELALTGRLVSGDELLQLGFLQEVTDSQNLMNAATTACRRLAESPQESFARTKTWLYEDVSSELSHVFQAARDAHRGLFRAGVSQRGSSAFVNK